MSRINKNVSEQDTRKIIFFEKKYRKVENINSDEKSIILFGCSFTKGYMLEDNETFSHKLAKYSGRTVYNRADNGWGPQHMLFQLTSLELDDVIVKEPEFVVYTFIYDNVNRIGFVYEPIINCVSPTFIYKKSKDTLKYDYLNNWYFKFPLLTLIKKSYYLNFENNNDKAELLKLHFLNSKKQIDRKWPNAKFVIFVYEDNYEMLSIIQELRKENIFVITFDELMKESSYKQEWHISKDDYHPNSEAWNNIVPKFYGYLNNINKNENSELSDIEIKLLNIRQNSINNEPKEKYKNMFRMQTQIKHNSMFSIDDEIIKQKKLSKVRVRSAFVIWCVANFIQDTFKLPVENSAIKLSKKINPYNYSYNLIK